MKTIKIQIFVSSLLIATLIATQSFPDAYFEIPKPLTHEEKQQNVQERIEKKYNGQLPGQIEDLIFYYENYELCKEKKVHLPNRILFHGVALDKDHLVTILSQELQVPVISCSSEYFADENPAVSFKRMYEVFSVAKQFEGPLFVVIQDLDTLAQSNDIADQNAAMGALRRELDECTKDKNIFIFATAHKLSGLDAATKDRFAGSIIQIK